MTLEFLLSSWLELGTIELYLLIYIPALQEELDLAACITQHLFCTLISPIISILVINDNNRWPGSRVSYIWKISWKCKGRVPVLRGELIVDFTFCSKIHSFLLSISVAIKYGSNSPSPYCKTPIWKGLKHKFLKFSPSHFYINIHVHLHVLSCLTLYVLSSPHMMCMDLKIPANSIQLQFLSRHAL